MGDENQFEFVKENLNIFKSPILEIGSKDYGNTPNYRSLFSGVEYTGIDMFEGKGVDFTLDMTDDINILTSKLGSKKFKTIFCSSVLEHTKNPFKMCSNISDLLDDDGVVYISAPFSWRIHGYPDDYWRFTPNGIKLLFPKADFDTFPCNLSGITGEIFPIHENMMRVQLGTSKGRKAKQYGRPTSIFIRLFKKLNIFPFVFKYPYLCPPVMVNMIGVKKP